MYWNCGLCWNSEWNTPGGLVGSAWFPWDFDGELSGLVNLPPPITLFALTSLGGCAGYALGMEASWLTHRVHLQFISKMVEEIRRFDIMHLSELMNPARFGGDTHRPGFYWSSPMNHMLCTTEYSFYWIRLGLTNTSGNI